MDPLTSAVIGGVTALGVRAGLKYFATLWSARRELREYSSGYESRRGEPGALQHGWGGAACDVRTRHVVWAHSHVRHEHFSGDGTLRLVQHTIFGPYTNDFGRPGVFRITFRFCARGFARDDRRVMTFDVQQSAYGNRDEYYLLTQKVMRASDLTGDFQAVELECYTTGMGVFEYRASVEPEIFDALRHEILFDTVRVHRVFPVQDIL